MIDENLAVGWIYCVSDMRENLVAEGIVPVVEDIAEVVDSSA